jgi:hypothetical protein
VSAGFRPRSITRSSSASLWPHASLGANFLRDQGKPEVRKFAGFCGGVSAWIGYESREEPGIQSIQGEALGDVIRVHCDRSRTCRRRSSELGDPLRSARFFLLSSGHRRHVRRTDCDVRFSERPPLGLWPTRDRRGVYVSSKAQFPVAPMTSRGDEREPTEDIQ